MSWKMKVALMVRDGKSREEAMEEVLNTYEMRNRQLDQQLAEMFSQLSPEKQAAWARAMFNIDENASDNQKPS